MFVWFGALLMMFVLHFFWLPDITCESTRTKAGSLENGKIQCTNSNNFESVCSYECDLGYGLSDEALTNTTCVDSGGGDANGAWSTVAPECVGVWHNELILKIYFRTKQL